jgi:hypothetical protein
VPRRARPCQQTRHRPERETNLSPPVSVA